MFKREQFTLINDVPADLERAVRFWDTAMSSKTTADHTVGVLLGITTRGRFVVLDVRRFRMEWGDVQQEIVRVAQQDGSQVLIGIEEVAFMSRAVQELLVDSRMHHYSVQGVKPDKDKVTRARAFEARVNAGLVDIYRGSWAAGYMDELCSFPFGAHDDQVDASSGAYAMLDGADPSGLGVLAGDINYADYGGYSSSEY
jgi:predicted phage terminase large subunit-like protein